MFSTKTVPFIMYALFFIQCNTYSPENKLLAPENWKSEIIKFPLGFAPNLKYSGEEYVRFAPGWGDITALDYFSYAFLWDINEDPKLSSKKLEGEMEAYFNGLVKKDDFKSKAFFEKINDTHFIGKVITHDSFTANKEVQLNIIVTQQYCDQTKRHLVLFNISPQNLEHQVWKQLKKIEIAIDC
ncbi:hypothetical protein ABW636_16690 [Aquimarina sp. 2201CG1-2-11]|uniref:hypothetical protein n=1 Tax=Aquimarina discodermiae TaxID=3231043 RepID=UPI003462E7ED